MNTYDPDQPPDARDWLALDEAERLRLVESAHAAERDQVQGFDSHCALHVVVENQLAAGQPPATRETLSRLTDEGLERHEALHAIAGVVAALMFKAMQGTVEALELNDRLSEQLAQLTPDSLLGK